MLKPHPGDGDVTVRAPASLPRGVRVSGACGAGCGMNVPMTSADSARSATTKYTRPAAAGVSTTAAVNTPTPAINPPTQSINVLVGYRSGATTWDRRLERAAAEDAEDPEQKDDEEDGPDPDARGSEAGPGEPATEGAEDEQNEDDDQ